MPGPIRSGQIAGPTGDYATDLANGWIQTKIPGTQGPITALNASVPAAGFPAWNAALAKVKAGTGIGTVWAWGASIIAGGTAVTDMLTKPYFALWRAAKRAAGYVTHGDSFLVTACANFNSLVTYSVAPWTMDVVPTVWGYYGPFIAPAWTTQTTMPLCHATSPGAALGYNPRSARFFYFDVGNQDGGTSSVGRTSHATMDGANDTLITELGDNKIHFVDFTNLSDIPNHVLNIGNQGAASIAITPILVSWFPTTTIPTSGIHYCWFGVPGSYSMFDLARSDGTAPKWRIERFMGPSNAPTGDPPASPFTPDSTLSPPFAPHLVIGDVLDDLAFVNVPTASGSNPAFTVNGGPADAYFHGLRRVIQTLRVKPFDFVHHMPNFPDGFVSDIQPGAAYQLQNSWHYYKAIKDLADLNGHGWLDTDAEWAESALAKGFMVAGNPHPTDLGHADIYARITSRLGL